MINLRQIRRPRQIIGLLIIIMLLWLGVKIARSANDVRLIYASLSAATAQLRQQPPFSRTPQLQNELYTIDQNLRSLSGELEPLRLLCSPMGKACPLGEKLHAATEVLDIGRGLTTIGQGLLKIDGLFTEGNEAPTVEAQMSAIARSTDQLAALAAQASTIEQRLNALPAEQFPALVAEPLQQGKEAVSLLAAGLQLLPISPGLLGFDRPRSYLLLMQNNHELRATGGFITAVGVLQVTAGEIQLLDFTDSYNIMNDAVKHPWAPKPMQRYLGVDLLFLRDANWSPDFPTTAQLARTLYAQNEGLWVDGVMTLDLRAVELLVGSMEPLRIGGLEQPITSANLQSQMKKFWRNAAPDAANVAQSTPEDWWRQRKDFMPLIAKALLERVDAGTVDHSKVAGAILQALDERAIQLWVNDQAANEVLARADWTGAIQPVHNADFLALVDSNFGYNKVDSVIQRAIQYQVSWPVDPAQPGQAVATISYHHPLSVPNHVCDQTPRYGDSYDEMAARCYFDYVRLYTPLGSRLQDVEGVDRSSVQSMAGVNGTQVFGLYFELPPGGQQQITFYYELPPTVRPEGYQLLIRRQSGMYALPVQLNVAGKQFQGVVDKGSLLWQPTP